MQDNTVVIEPAATGHHLRFAPRFNAAAAFIDRHVAVGHGATVAIRTAGDDVSYADLADRVARCGNALRGLGIAPGERMLMAVLDGPAFFYLFWGAIKAGIVPVPLNTLLRAADYAWLIEDSACAAFVHSPELAAEVESALAQAHHRPAVVLRTGGDDAALPALLARASAELAPLPRRAEDACFWLYSSGSTGRPKGVVHAQRDLVVTSQRYAVETIGVRPTDIFFSAAKLFFAYGLGNGMAFPLWVGGTSVLMPERPTPENTFATIARFRPTIFFGVPTLFARQIAEMPRLRTDLSSLRFCVSAGEALPAHLFESWRRLTGTEIIDGIGSTEAAHMYISHRPGSAVAGSTGRPLPGYEVKIVDESGAAVPSGQPGRLLVRGESVGTCYWRNANPITVDGWLDTGDIYRVDADGFYVYAGRSDDMMKVGGIWCSPVEIEAALLEHPDVLEAAVVGREDDDGLVKPEAWIVPKNPDTPYPPGTATELVRHCKTRLAPYKYPRWVHFVPDLPKTATGKIQRFMLRQRRPQMATPEAAA